MTEYLCNSLAWSALWFLVGYSVGRIVRCDNTWRRK